jgi:hypothetical protein
MTFKKAGDFTLAVALALLMVGMVLPGGEFYKYLERATLGTKEKISIVSFLMAASILLSAVKTRQPVTFAILQIGFGLALAWKSMSFDFTDNPVLNGFALLGAVFIVARALAEVAKKPTTVTG